METYYSVPRPSPGEIQQDVWQDHSGDAIDDDYHSLGVKSLKNKFLGPQVVQRSPRSLGSSRAPPPRPMTPPRDFDGREIYDGAERQMQQPQTPLVQQPARAQPRGTYSKQSHVSPPGSKTIHYQPVSQPSRRAPPPRPEPQPNSRYQTSITVQPSAQQSSQPHHSPPLRPQPRYSPDRRTLATMQSTDGPDASDVRVVHLQYNSPLQLYSSGNAKQTLDAQTKGAPGFGTLVVKGTTQEFNPDTSHVLRAIRDEEGPRKSGFQPVTGRNVHIISHGSDF